jgi:transposase
MTERQQQRLVNHRMAVIRHAEEVTGNVAQTCRYFGISRQTFYVWLRRYEEKGLEGLRDRSRRPHHSPNATSAEVVGKIIYLRQNYHFGPGKIAMYLRRYHEIIISPSGVWRILCRLELNRLPSSQRHKTYQKRWQRYEKPQPGHRVQIDVKFITPVGAAGKRFHQLTAIDDCTRLRVLRASTTSATAASDTSTSNRPPPDSTARSNDPTASTKKSSTGYSTASSSTTPTCSTTSCKSGRTSDAQRDLLDEHLS